MTASGKKLQVVVLLSGSGSNLQAIIDNIGSMPVEICAVVSNKADAYGLARAEKAGITTCLLDHKTFPDRDSYDRALLELVDNFNPGLVILAGFMRILTTRFVNHFHGRMLNIHPSLLPKFRGLHTHQRALDEGETTHGVSVHFVTEELDGGPLIAQAEVPVNADDDADKLGSRVLKREHRLYPMTIRWFAEGRLKLSDDQLQLDGKSLNGPVIFKPNQDIPLS
ncbi:MAG: phosphoribosylglycinamide formyltransferase [Candidatus Polarisedimenticolaceae bacterium]|nr:phosphoribosylglycinamide formyltransferase [Candidatus Polarisedimenticolaceae bacterium]